MRTDLKIGMLIGVVIVIITILIISYLPGGSIEERLKIKSLQEQAANNETILPGPENENPADNHRDNVNMPDVNPQVSNDQLQQVLDRLYTQAGQVVDDSNNESTQDSGSSDEVIKAPIIRIRTYHTVQEGQTLSHISMQYYGTTSKWDLIQQANKEILPNPNLLRVGMKLAIPEE